MDGDPELEITGIVEGILDRWQVMRQGAIQTAADNQFRRWLLETLPFEAGSTPDDLCFVVFEVARTLVGNGRIADGFMLLRWLGEHYVHHQDSAVAARVIVAVTDMCAQLGSGRTEEAAEEAIQVLRAVVDSVRGRVDINVERALCRALVHSGYLRTEQTSPGSRQTEDLVALWTEIARRWCTSKDPELRGRAAQALWSKAMLWLQLGDEQAMRQELAELMRHFATDRTGVSTEVDRLIGADQWVIRARYAPALLDRLVIPPPELKTEYLEVQRRADRRMQRQGLGIPWLRAGAPRNHMRALIRRAREWHQVSAARIRSWVCSGEPFVLVLRNFALTERSVASSSFARWMRDDDLYGDQLRVISFSKTEAVLNELVEGGVPLVQVANTAAGELGLTPFPQQFVARTQLYLPDATWFKTVTMLMAVAEQVIVWAHELTVAFAQELAALKERERTADTVVLLEKRDRDPIVDIALGQHGTPRHIATLSADHPALAGFPNVVPAEQLAGKRVHECPELMQMLARLETARVEAIEQRMARLLARLDAELAERS
jgi:hypothetical protein